MPPGLDQLKHIVVLMMENRSFDHMLGYLKAQDPRIDGVTGTETNPDTQGGQAPVLPQAQYQGQLDPDPGHHFWDVNTQLFGDPPGSVETMQGFVKAYFQKKNDVGHSHKIMYCFPPAKVGAIATLARKYAVFNRWFSSIPGPTIPNRAFAHFGTSFGKVDMDLNYIGVKYPTIYERMVKQGHTAKIYYYDQTLAMTFLLQDQPQLFGTYDDFEKDYDSDSLPDYCFLEPNYADHSIGTGTMLAADQHPDHNVLAGEKFIADVYMKLTSNQARWQSTLLLILYDEHGGIYDHVPPPGCVADEFQDPETKFTFNRLGIRVPAVLVSPWIPQGTVINDGPFDHASIPATVTARFIGPYAERSPRELNAKLFLDEGPGGTKLAGGFNYLTLDTPRTDEIPFVISSGSPFAPHAALPPGTVALTQPPAEAGQPARPVSMLLWEQVQTVRTAEERLPADQQTHIDINTIKTEGEASAYVQQVMAKLGARHTQPAQN